MKISKFFKAFSLTTALAMSSGFLTIPMVKAQTSGNFSYSCSNIKLKSQDFSTTAILTADCRRRDGTTNYGTSINLNDYITNHFGQLQWRRNGHFQQSCFGMQLSKMGYNFAHNIEGYCDAYGGSMGAGIDLDQDIKNDNGNLVYIGP